MKEIFGYLRPLIKQVKQLNCINVMTKYKFQLQQFSFVEIRKEIVQQFSQENSIKQVAAMHGTWQKSPSFYQPKHLRTIAVYNQLPYNFYHQNPSRFIIVQYQTTMSQSPNPKTQQQATTAKTINKYKNRNDFSFADSVRSTENVARNLYHDRKYLESIQSSRNKSGININDRTDKNEKQQSGFYLADSSIFKENFNNRQRIKDIYNKMSCSGVNHEELELIKNDHRIEVEKLVLEISRLHDVIYEMQLHKKIEINKLKEEYEHLSYLNSNNLKQSHESQLKILQQQLRSVRNALDQKTNEYEVMEKQMQKQRKMYKAEVQNLHDDLKAVVQNKNDEIYRVQEQCQHKINNISSKNDSDMAEVKDICDREIKKLYREVEDKEKTLRKISEKGVEYERENQKLREKIEREKQSIEEKMKEIIQRGNAKYQNLQSKIDELLEEETQAHEGKLKMYQDVLETQIKNLMVIIRNKDQELHKQHAYVETSKASQKIHQASLLQQIAELKEKLKKVSSDSLRQIQELKVKMAVLHQNDIKQLVSLYDSKVEVMNNQILSLEKENSRLHSYMHEESHRWYQNKKRYEIKISKLNTEIMGLKVGLGDLEKSMNEKIENQRSALLITSQNLIRDAQLKNSNAKFYEDQLRKLRGVLELETEKHSKHEKEIQKAYKALEQENKNLISKNKELLQEHNQMETQFYQVLNERDDEIKKLNLITQQILEGSKDGDSEKVAILKEQINHLESQIKTKNDTIKELERRVTSLERSLSDIKSENQQLFLQNQITSEQSRSQYQSLVDQNMGDLKKFYERKIQELESDKAQLITRNSAEASNLAELVRRYNQLEASMKEMMKQAKKKSELQQKIIELGMDNNLVSNKASLLKTEFE